MERVKKKKEGVRGVIDSLLRDDVWDRLRGSYVAGEVEEVREYLQRMPAKSSGFRMFCDGASSGNPGPSGAGGVILDEAGTLVDSYSIHLGVATNNVAEYTALLEGLDRLLLLQAKRAEIFLDSELIVRQLSGRYKVKSPHLQPLFREVRDRLSKIPVCDVRHVPRDENQEADRLAREGAKKSGI